MFHANGNQKKDGVTILVSDKINIKIKTVVKDKERLHNDKGVNPTRGYNICKYLCTQHRST